LGDSAAPPLDPAESAGVERESDKVPPLAKASYALGGTTDLLGHWLYNQLANQVFTTILGLTPTDVSKGLLSSRLVDAFTDPLFGWLSDNTRSRWGRRRPYIVVGSIFAGVALPFLFLASPNWSYNKIFWFMIISACLYAPLISAYNMPYQSLGAELTPNYNERTSVLGWRAVVQKISGMLLGIGGFVAGRHYWDDPVTGKATPMGAFWFCAGAGLLMVISGFANFLFVRERYYAKAQKQERVGFFKMFGASLTCKPYLVLLATALVYAIPTGLVGSLGYYITTYYVFHGDMSGGTEYAMYGSILYALFGAFIGVPVATRLSHRYGKHKALSLILVMGLFVFASSWWLYDPAHPAWSVLQTALNGFAATGLWVVLPSMCIDVVDYDELYSGQRREGAYSSTFSWVLKVGMAGAMGMVGPLLDSASGFNAKLGGDQSPHTMFMMRLLFTVIPTAAIVVAIILVQLFPLTRERMHEIRVELEKRRGTV